MWDQFYVRRAMEMGPSFDMFSSPFAFPRLPPRANQLLGISTSGKIKEMIVRDKDLAMNRLNANHDMFQRYASGLFDLSPANFVPGHPMNYGTGRIVELQEHNDKLRKENSILKANKKQEKKN